MTTFMADLTAGEHFRFSIDGPVCLYVGDSGYYRTEECSVVHDPKSTRVERLDTQLVTGRKDDVGKSRPDLFSPRFLLEIGDVLAHGAAKYGEKNWSLVERARYVAAGTRHWLLYLSGESVDKDTGKSHLSHLASNLSFLWEKDQDATSPESERGQ